MKHIAFMALSDVDPEDLQAVLNEPALRQHLIDHADFDANSLNEWIALKCRADSLPGCRIRAVYIDGALAGWCGIQPDAQGFELAIVISQRCWGCGISIFNTLMRWARELGHTEIRLHLLDSRPQYKALAKMATKVEQTWLSGRWFTRYWLAVSDDPQGKS